MVETADLTKLSSRTLQLPKKLIEQLGKLPDRLLATQFGVTTEQVYRARSAKGISVAKFVWTAERISLLGTESDKKIAIKLGLAVRTICAKRKSLGTPAFGSTQDEKRHKWTKSQLNLLGKHTDVYVATKTGTSTSTVAVKRRILGIAPSTIGERKVGAKAKLSRGQRLRLGKESDSALARKWGMHRHQVAIYRQELGIENFVKKEISEFWTPEVIARLGKESDSKIASDLQVAIQRVSSFRREKGIPLFGRKGKGKKSIKMSRATTKARKETWTEGNIARLGQVSDRTLAKELGITFQAISRMRNRLGVSVFKPPKSNPSA